MPPKPKYTKDQIVAAAVEVVAQKGADALTAKELSLALGTSTSPIFTVFDSMQQVQEAVREVAMQRFEEFAADARQDMPFFKQVGLKMVFFGAQQPKLYQLLFMQEHSPATTFDDIFSGLGQTAVACIKSVEQEHGLPPAKAKQVFEHMWIYTFGVGALCATGACHFTEAELSEKLSAQFKAVMLLAAGQ